MPTLSSPWREFLAELDAALPESVDLHCIGGFVVNAYCGLPRPTGDIDYYTAIPADVNLDAIAGRGSTLAKKHGVYLQRVAVNNMPDDYDSRLTEMFPQQFEKLRLFAPDPYDLILSKLERNSPKDRHDSAYLFRELRLSTKALHERYQNELLPYLARPEREDLTLKLWIEIFETDARK
jgi:hypothetical protein